MDIIFGLEYPTADILWKYSKSSGWYFDQGLYRINVSAYLYSAWIWKPVKLCDSQLQLWLNIALFMTHFLQYGYIIYQDTTAFNQKKIRNTSL